MKSFTLDQLVQGIKDKHVVQNELVSPKNGAAPVSSVVSTVHAVK